MMLHRTMRVLGVAVLLGCNGLTDKDTPPEPLAVLTGKIIATPDTKISGPLSLAVLWVSGKKSCQGPSGQKISCPPLPEEALNYELSFPTDFKMPINGVPPSEARLALTETTNHGTLAVGIVIAFIDKNEDKLFNLGKPGIPSDPVFGFTERGRFNGGFGYSLLYLDGEYDVPEAQFSDSKDFLQPSIPKGYSVVESHQGAEGTLFTSVKSIETQVQLDLTPLSSSDEEVFLTVLTCLEIEYRSLSCDAPPCGVPPRVVAPCVIEL
jgi:hypothetical protein